MSSTHTGRQLRGRWSAVIAIGVAAAAVLVWLFRVDHTVTSPSPETGHHQPTPAPDRAPEDSSGQPTRTPALPEPSVLAVTVIERGKPAQGRATFVTGPDLRDLHSDLPAISQPEWRESAAAQVRDFNGGFEIVLPADHCCWLRVEGRESGPILERIGPFGGRQNLRIDLDTITRSIHVLVLESDFRTPAKDAEVVASVVGVMGGPVREIGRPRSGTDGCLRLDDLPEGRILLRGVGAPWEDGASHTAVVWFPPGGGNRHTTALIVLPERRAHLRLQVMAEGIRGRAIAPKLFLQRLDQTAALLWPQTGLLADGPQDLDFHLPPGTYAAAVLPMHEYLVHGATVEVPEQGEASATVHLTAVAERTQVHLTGPGIQHFPLRVYAQPMHGIRDDDPDHMFLGPFHWHAATESLPRSTETILLGAAGRQASFVSKEPIRLQGSRVDVAMVPATCLSVVWTRWDPHADREPVMEVCTPSGEWIRPLQRRVIDGPGGKRPALVGDILVPLGPVEVAYRRPGKDLVWLRQIVARDCVTRVMITD